MFKRFFSKCFVRQNNIGRLRYLNVQYHWLIIKMEQTLNPKAKVLNLIYLAIKFQTNCLAWTK